MGMRKLDLQGDWIWRCWYISIRDFEEKAAYYGRPVRPKGRSRPWNPFAIVVDIRRALTAERASGTA
jgi:hypothetical protein